MGLNPRFWDNAAHQWTTFTTSKAPPGDIHLYANIIRRFGNFIGEAEESEDESQQGTNGHDAYVFDDEVDENGVPNDQQLMEIDGMQNPVSRAQQLTLTA